MLLDQHSHNKENVQEDQTTLWKRLSVLGKWYFEFRKNLKKKRKGLHGI